MTTQLLLLSGTQSAFDEADSRRASVSTVVEALDRVVQPLADGRLDNNQHKRNLEEIVKRSATFGLTLFGQTSCYRFDWKKSYCEATGELCIFPALLQIVDEGGRTCSPPRAFSEAVTRSLITL